MPTVQDLAGSTFCAGNAGVTMGTAVSVTMANAVSFAINGKAYLTTGSATNAAVTSFLDPNTGVAPVGVGPGQGCIFVCCAVSTGTVATFRFVQSEIVPLLPNSAQYTPGAFQYAPEFPAIPDNLCPVAYFVVKVATDYTPGGKHTFGTTSVATGAMGAAATAYAITAQNILTLPNRPQMS
jgi:hypothetical protein